jgi:hypothetical protein
MEFHTPLVICDKCHPGEDILIENGALLSPPPAHGYSVGFSVEQMLENGWEEREYGIVCPVCVANEIVQTELDEATGATSGATGITNLLQPDMPINMEAEAEAAAVYVEGLVAKEKKAYAEAGQEITTEQVAHIENMASANTFKENNNG